MAAVAKLPPIRLPRPGAAPDRPMPGRSGGCRWLRRLSEEPAVLPCAQFVHEGQMILALVLAVDHDELAAQAPVDHRVVAHRRHGAEHVLGEVDAALAIVV